jgi:hypothetical protein
LREFIIFNINNFGGPVTQKVTKFKLKIIRWLKGELSGCEVAIVGGGSDSIAFKPINEIFPDLESAFDNTIATKRNPFGDPDLLPQGEIA